VDLATEVVRREKEAEAREGAPALEAMRPDTPRPPRLGYGRIGEVVLALIEAERKYERMELLKPGLHPLASDAFRRAGVVASRLGQTIGTAKASAGTHEADGHVNGKEYCAATDLRCRDLSEAEVKELLDKLGLEGFAAFYRKPGFDHWPASEALHIHAVYSNCPMKKILRSQVHDFLHGFNGLASHAEYHFHKPTKETCDKVRELFLLHNPANG
jgi:hypothetical protein